MAARAGATAIRSLSFSGAGFLGSYHVGATSALKSLGILPDYAKHNCSTPEARQVTLLGASAGSLVAAAVFSGSRDEDLMNIIIDVAAQSRRQPLDALTPGFSLIDVLEPHLRAQMEAVNPELMFRRMEKSRLRIALTNPTPMYLVQAMQHNRVVDDFVDIEHLVAACLLSSYVPGVTGPLRPTEDSAAGRAAITMANRWRVKQSREGSIELVDVVQGPEEGAFIDGGLTTMFPVMDAATVIVSPLSVRSERGVICPPGAVNQAGTVNGGQGVRVEVSTANMLRGKQAVVSPTQEELERSFRDGHDDAMRFMRDREGPSVHQHVFMSAASP